MPVCPSCSAAVSPQSRFCPGCGAPVARGATDPEAPTTAHPHSTPSPSAGSPTVRIAATFSSFGTAPSDAAMFAPGTVLAKRFRIIARLGKGGMGEVYRADDLKLGQEVALKFLPAGVAFDEHWLTRFKAEVRVARQVSHPNLCRVYDLDEVETPGGTLHFISMEYIDGEDLGSLLRRIGRLPKDKAVQVARQLCAGLGAAHAAGIIHRDLKPANIMLDGRGQARIADFGIAGYIGQIAAGDIRSGTPEYMSPEQLAGREVTVRSDVYCLGLVLYELFTGHRVAESDTFPTGPGSRTRSRDNVASPSRHVDDMDPSVERTIMRCLDDDPASRPGSALSVAAALPGGDPLQAALEAGETPSPELVAAAGSRDAIKLRWALAIVLPGLLAVAFMIAASGRTQLINFIPPPKSRAVLADRAAEMLRELGFDAPADTADSFSISPAYLAYIQEHDDNPERWWVLLKGRPAVLRYWYRASPEAMLPVGMSGSVLRSDPARDKPGMVTIELDTAGRLNYLAAVPPREAPLPSPQTDKPPDWDLLFRLAGLDRSQFEEADATEPLPFPPHHAQHVALWIGAWPGHFDLPLRVEAGWTAGKPVYFALRGTWDRDQAHAAKAGGAAHRIQRQIGGMARTLLLAAAIVSAVFMARRNLRLGRGDRRGAFRLAGALLALDFVGWFATASHVTAARAEWRLFMQAFAGALLAGAVAWLLYMALEPFVRRRNPRLIVSWQRLLRGDWRDAMVGRDVILGFSAGALLVSLDHVVRVVNQLMGWPGPQPRDFAVGFLAGPAGMIGILASTLINAVIEGLLPLFLLVALTALLRRAWIAGILVGAVLFASALGGASPGSLAIFYALQAVGLALLVVMIARFGLLVMIAGSFTVLLLSAVPLTHHLDQWHAQGTIAVLVIFGGLASWGLWTAVGRRLALPIAPPERPA